MNKTVSIVLIGAFVIVLVVLRKRLKIFWF